MYRIEGLWRYPVKTLAGEPITEAALTADGVPGDRPGARAWPGRGAHLPPSPPARAAGHAWPGRPAARERAAVAERGGPRPRPRGGGRRCLARRPRPVRSASTSCRCWWPPTARCSARHPPLAPQYPDRRGRGARGGPVGGRVTARGPVVIRLDCCAAAVLDDHRRSGHLERDPEVLRDIGRRFGGRLALNAEVLQPGVVRVGDPVVLER